MNTQEKKNKKQKTYKITEKEYAKAKRDRERLLAIKPLVSKIAKITSQVK